MANSSWQDITTTGAAGLLVSPDARQVLGAFLRPATLTDAAIALGRPLDQVRYHARRAQRAGLLHQAGTRRRRGPAQVLYQLSAPPFFVPGALIPGGPDALLHPDEDAFTARLRATRAALLAEAHWGLLVNAGSGGLSAEITRPHRQDTPTHTQLQAVEAPAIIDISCMLSLSHEEAKQLQAALWALMEARRDHVRQEGSHLLRLTLYPASS